MNKPNWILVLFVIIPIVQLANSTTPSSPSSSCEIMASLPFRRLASIVKLPPPSPGFMGQGHTAIEVLNSRAISKNDPFVLLMDDRVDVGYPARKMGGAHPHAGLETVTLFLEGSAEDKEEGNAGPGDAQWMTAGRGIIHGENMVVGGRLRVLQLWIRLPASDRQVPPRVQLLKKSHLPTYNANGATAYLYSGRLGDSVSPTMTYAPVTITDIQLQPAGLLDQDLPSDYSGFLYCIDGAVTITGGRGGAGGRGEEGEGEEKNEQILRVGEVGYFDSHADNQETSLLRVTGGPAGGRAILYSGRPQREPLIHHGPFVAGSQAEIRELFYAYQQGGFTRLSELGGIA